MIPPDAEWRSEERRARVLAALGDVWDPELGLDVVALGLVYDVRVSGDDIEIDMTLTTPGCPVSEQLPAEAEAAVRAALPGAEVTVRVVWDPPWTPERLSPLALRQLGFEPRDPRRGVVGPEGGARQGAGRAGGDGARQPVER